MVCRNGHTHVQRNAYGACVQCNREAAARYRKRLQTNDRIVRAARGELSIANAPQVMA